MLLLHFLVFLQSTSWYTASNYHPYIDGTTVLSDFVNNHARVTTYYIANYFASNNILANVVHEITCKHFTMNIYIQIQSKLLHCCMHNVILCGRLSEYQQKLFNTNIQSCTLATLRSIPLISRYKSVL